jgi:hypothetical protein
MKKLILSTTFLIAGTFCVLAQGVVDFSNANWEAWPEATPPDRFIYLGSVAPGNAISDTAFTAALFEQRGGNWVQLGDRIGFYGAGLEGIFASDGIQRTLGVPALTATTLKISIFDPSGTELTPVPGLNYQGVMTNTPNIFPYTQAISVPIPSPTDTLMVNMRAFAVVPEPSTIALGVLGLGALLLFRRRK